MRPSLLLAASLLILPMNARPADAAPAPAPAPAPADAIQGRWKPSENDVVVSIARSAAGLEGVVVESPANPALVGKQMLRALVYDASRGEWSGEVFAVKKGEFVPAVIRLQGAGFVLTAGHGFMSRKVSWTRA